MSKRSKLLFFCYSPYKLSASHPAKRAAVTEKATQSVFEASLLSHAEVCKGRQKRFFAIPSYAWQPPGDQTVPISMERILQRPRLIASK
jgi:hypothetical protein